MWLLAVTFLMIGILPFGFLGLLRWSLRALFQRRKTTAEAETQTSTSSRVPKEVQANRGMSRAEHKFSEEYVDRCTDLEALLSQRCRQIREMEQALFDLRNENRQLQQRVENLRRRREPEEIAVAPARGQKFHLPSCGHLKGSHVKVYGPCRDCIG